MIITPELPSPPPADVTVPLKVHVERSKLREVSFGGGIEFKIRSRPTSISSRAGKHNFLGGLRTFHVQLRPGVVLYPLRMQTPLDAPTNMLPEEKLRAELRQPGFLEARTTGILRSQVNTYPILLTPQQSGPGVPVLGYLENKEAIGVDRSFWKLYASPTYNFQHDQPFAYIAPRDPALGPIIQRHYRPIHQRRWRRRVLLVLSLDAMQRMGGACTARHVPPQPINAPG